MQTLRKQRRMRIEDKPSSARQQWSLRSPNLRITVAVVCLFIALLIVQQMAGFDADTVFLAVYCALVADFVINCFVNAFAPRW